MLDLFKTHIDTNLAFLQESKLLIAISGGLDSIVLTHLCHKLDLNSSLAHCNFNLRGDESDADEAFILQVAEDLELEVFVESFETEVYAETYKISIQMAARELRYQWFEELASQLHFDYVLTAHHADDNLETFLINLSRGTGLEGLIGIPEVNGRLVRPLLTFSREQIEAYAQSEHLKWREDSSNASTKYLRNKLRHEIIPKLKEINPELLKNFQTTQANLQESQWLVDENISKAFKKVVDEVKEDKVYFNIKKLKKLKESKPYLYQFLKPYGFTEWDDVANLLEAQTGKQVFSATHGLLKNREQLILFKLQSNEFSSILIENSNAKVATAMGTLGFEGIQEIKAVPSNSICVDKDLLKFPLTVRQWKKGDYFYPLGMQGSKKLSKFFKDEKYSLLDKEKALVLCSQDQIIWVVNKRMDNRYKVTEKTKNILKITIN